MTQASNRINTRIKGTIGGPGGAQYLVVDIGTTRLIVPKIGAVQTIIGVLGAYKQLGGT